MPLPIWFAGCLFTPLYGGARSRVLYRVDFVGEKESVRYMNGVTARERELELYFHIPFCVKKCLYCDFLSFPVGNGALSAGNEKKQRYMEALLAETAGSALSYRQYRVSSIFIGGGTPSVIPAEKIEELMDTVREHYQVDADAEVTIEVNPGTVIRGGMEEKESMERYRKAGVNRLSIGLQSARNEELIRLGRIHTWEQFQETYGRARKAGFSNINVDVMSALPGQTLLQYRETLEKILNLPDPPEHISAYSLILEEGTPFYERYEENQLELPDEDTDRLMYQETKRLLWQNGYHRYEISNYAKKGYECRHNCGYWQRKNYAGFGIGAASLVENVRFCNGRDLNAYLSDPFGCREEIHSLNREEQMEEFMFLGLRMTEGVNPVDFERLYKCDIMEVYGDVIRKNIRDGLLEESAGGREPVRIALTDRGLDVSNYVMAQFLL